MLPEAAEAHLPLQSKNKETDTKSENNTESSVHIQPAHLNGSLKSAALEEIDEMNNKIDVVNTATVDEEEHRHSLWKWPAGQGNSRRYNCTGWSRITSQILKVLYSKIRFENRLSS